MLAAVEREAAGHDVTDLGAALVELEREEATLKHGLQLSLAVRAAAGWPAVPGRLLLQRSLPVRTTKGGPVPPPTSSMRLRRRDMCGPS